MSKFNTVIKRKRGIWCNKIIKDAKFFVSWKLPYLLDLLSRPQLLLFHSKRKVFQSTLNPSRDALFVPMLQNFFGCRINRVIAPKEFYLIKTIFDNILVSNLGCKTSAFLRGKEKSTIAGNDQVNFLVEIKLRMKKSSIFLFRRKWIKK